MKRSIILVVMFFLAVLPSPAQQQPPRQVKDQILTSTALPPIRIKFADEFKHVGTLQFVLYDRAQVEQHFFIDADNEKRIKRMYWVQFEGYLPGVNAKYDYPANETVTLAGQTYLVNAESVPNVPEVVKRMPQSDVERAIKFLEAKGYRMGPSIRYERFVRLVDEAKRNEMILTYIEDASASTENAGKELLTRAQKGFTILE